MKQFVLLCAFLLSGWAVQAQTSAKSVISVYPNPATEFISVNDHTDQVGEIAIYNMVGRRIKLFEFVKGENYSVADLAKGMYLVQLIDKQKHVITTQKVDKR